MPTPEVPVRSSHVQFMADTLRVALLDAARQAAPPEGDQTEGPAGAFTRAAEAMEATRDQRPAGEAPVPLPPVGATAEQDLTVGPEDTAAAMGHPDPAVAVLGTPRLALWFEMASSAHLPPLPEGMTHVGTGVLVHHLGRAAVGEEVRVTARLEEARGRRVLFSCGAWAGERLVALGAHHRILVTAAPPG